MEERFTKPVAIDKTGMVLMQASDEFRTKIAPVLGLRDVFKLQREAHKKKFNMREGEHTFGGTTVKCTLLEPTGAEVEEPSREEIDQYIIARDTYAAEQVLYKCGWADFVRVCSFPGIAKEACEELKNRHTPCEGPDGQCHMDCPQFGGCYE